MANVISFLPERFELGANTFHLPARSFNLGAWIGMIGKNGSGKTSFLRRIRDQRVREKKSVLYFCAEDLRDNPFRVSEILSLNQKINAGTFGQRFNRDVTFERFFSQLSAGERVKVLLHYAIQSQAECILWDEFLDVLERSVLFEIRDYFRECHPKVTVLFASHDLRLALELADECLWVSEKSPGVRILEGPAPASKIAENKEVAELFSSIHYVFGATASENAPPIFSWRKRL